MTKGAFKLGAFFLLLAGILFSPSSFSLPIVSKDDFQLEFSGYLQELAFHTDEFMGKDFSLSQSRARLVLDFNLPLGFSARISQSLQYDSGSALTNPFYQISKELAPETYFKWEKEIIDEHTQKLSWSIYRAWVNYENDWVHIRVGRQRVALGSAYFYSPLDLFNPQSPLSLEPDERIGVDGASIELYLGKSTYFTLAYGIGDVIDESRFAGAFKTTIKSYDLSLICARIFEDWTYGLAFSGYIKSASFYGEIAYFVPEQEDEFFRSTLGLQYGFANNVILTAEYYHNEGVISEQELLMSGGAVIFQDPLRTLDRNFLGINIGAELTPLVQVNFAIIYDLDSDSFYNGLSFSYLAPYSLTISAGAQLFDGKEQGDFGTLPNFLWAKIRWDF